MKENALLMNHGIPYVPMLGEMLKEASPKLTYSDLILPLLPLKAIRSLLKIANLTLY